MTHVLLLCPARIPSVILCGHSQLEWLDKEGIIEYKWSVSAKVTGKLISWADVVIFVRSDSKLETGLAKKLKKSGRYLIYVLDDDLLNVPEYIDSAEHYNQQETKKNIKNIMLACNCLLSPSAKLLTKYGTVFSKAALIEEPSLMQYDAIKASDGPVKIGFAGSVDRSQDVDELLAEPIGKLLQNYGDRISVEFFGAKPVIVDLYGLKYVPYCNSYESYLKTMSSLNWDIGLAPMPDDEFHSCKHYNKFIEYIGHGIAGVYSDVNPYKRVIYNGENGLLCKNTKEAWYSTLSRLIEDRSLRNKIMANCLDEARERFSVEATALRLRDAMDDILEFESRRAKIQGIGWLRFSCRFLWVISKCRKYGLKTPIVMIKKLKVKLFDRQEIS